MVSEILRLTTDERRELTARLVEFVNGRGPVFAAVGAESARPAVEHARHAERDGCDAVMAAPPTTAPTSASAVIGPGTCRFTTAPAGARCCGSGAGVSGFGWERGAGLVARSRVVRAACSTQGVG